MPMATMTWNPATVAVTAPRYEHHRQIPSSLQSSDIMDQPERYATPLVYHAHGHPRTHLMHIAPPDHRLYDNTPNAAQERSTDRPIERANRRTITRTLPHKGHELVEHIATANQRLSSSAINFTPVSNCRIPIAEQLSSANDLICQ